MTLLIAGPAPTAPIPVTVTTRGAPTGRCERDLAGALDGKTISTITFHRRPYSARTCRASLLMSTPPVLHQLIAEATPVPPVTHHSAVRHRLQPCPQDTWCDHDRP